MEEQNQYVENVTPVPKQEQVSIIFLDSLERNVKAEKAFSGLTATDLKPENELDVLFQKLERIFESEKFDESNSVYSHFTKFQKVKEMLMNDFIIEYEHLHHKLTQYDKKLPHTVVTFKLLVVQTSIKIT